MLFVPLLLPCRPGKSPSTPEPTTIYLPCPSQPCLPSQHHPTPPWILLLSHLLLLPVALQLLRLALPRQMVQALQDHLIHLLQCSICHTVLSTLLPLKMPFMFTIPNKPGLFVLSAICITLLLPTCHGMSFVFSPCIAHANMLHRSNDGLTLLITSSDGFCSCLTFAPGELGTVYHHVPQVKSTPNPVNMAGSPAASTPGQTPNYTPVPPLARQPSSQGVNHSHSPFTMAQPASPARSMSNASVFTQASAAQLAGESDASQNDTPQVSAMPGLTATSAGPPTIGGVPLYTPPQTPGYTAAVPVMNTTGPPIVPPAVGEKREGDPIEGQGKEKRRRIAPTPVTDPSFPSSSVQIAPPPAPASQADEAVKAEETVKHETFAKPNEH